MKKLLLSVATLLGMASVASAADLPAKARPLAPLPVASWTGCWISGGVGGGMWRQRHHDEIDPGFVQLTQDVDTGGDGWLGRVGGGCDYQFAGPLGNWVVGAFADYDWMNLKGQLVVPVNGLIGNEKESGSWAVGARLGYLPSPNLLTFVSAGWTQARFDGFTLFTNGFPVSVATIFSVPSTTYDGGFIGGGYEYRLPFISQNLTWKTEYRFNFYNARDLSYQPPALTGTATHMSTNVQTVTTSLVWRFNLPGAAVVAKY